MCVCSYATNTVDVSNYIILTPVDDDVTPENGTKVVTEGKNNGLSRKIL